MNGERLLLVALVLICVLPLAASLPAVADRHRDPTPTPLPHPELPSGAGYIVALDTVLAQLSSSHAGRAPAPGTRWSVEPVGAGTQEEPLGYCYLAEGWRICVLGKAGDPVPRAYDVHVEHASSGLAWLARVDASGDLLLGSAP